MSPSLRPLTAADLLAAEAIQEAAYLPLYREPAEILGSRLAVAPTCCWGAFDEDDGLTAYILSHPWPAAAPPAIGTALGAPPPGDNWFIHDLAIGEAARGLGLGRALVRKAADAALALGLVRGDLIAVQGAGGFWARMGYADPPDLPAALAAKVAGYGPDARYMTARLADLTA
ncbi:MAG: GNAT family N-acetyltransferase [Phenylobacterium sp.]|uniref:GNAT family N-acetyltransferase n=1 Tax=Phenylobacterium sp. TaxID=1871053 RepID=UPI002736F599|nr:GNAT family N-acetyltransferase [Phenylobacterium sp.]MDP3749050.1 GNAT family N-acetyltransferase [Phenylobacterium sp.]